MWPFKKKTRITPDQMGQARPIRLVEPATEESGDGVRMKVRFKTGRAARLLMRMPEEMSRTFELDEIGHGVWNQCDGKTSVRQIIRKVSTTHHLNLREAEVATVKFLDMLVRKGLVGMVVKKDTSKKK